MRTNGVMTPSGGPSRSSGTAMVPPPGGPDGAGPADGSADGSGDGPADAEVIWLFGEDPEAGRPGGGSGPRPRWLRGLGSCLVLCGLALLPWLVVLATDLPATATAAHWPAAWVGLDAAEAAGLITTGLLAVRGDARLGVAAAATATLLVVDAWFDTMTAARGGDLVSALAMAAFAELPLAALCAVLALRARDR